MVANQRHSVSYSGYIWRRPTTAHHCCHGARGLFNKHICVSQQHKVANPSLVLSYWLNNTMTFARMAYVNFALYDCRILLAGSLEKLLTQSLLLVNNASCHFTYGFLHCLVYLYYARHIWGYCLDCKRSQRAVENVTHCQHSVLTILRPRWSRLTTQPTQCSKPLPYHASALTGYYYIAPIMPTAFRAPHTQMHPSALQTWVAHEAV